MNWQQIDENTEIDSSFITCAEYQLFIDEQRKISQPCQPFHWISYKFPTGSANKPVTGMRLIDAEGFCQWLNQNYAHLGYNYRLPTLAEVQNYPSDNPKTGCWVSDADKHLITGVEQKYWEEWRTGVADLLERNCTIDYISALMIALDQVFLRDINIILCLRQAMILAKNLDGSEAVVRNHAFSKALERVYQFALDYARITATEMSNCQNLLKELENLKVFDTEFHLNRLRDLALNIDKKLKFDRDLNAELNLVREINLPQNRLRLTQTLNAIHELTIIRNKCILNTRSLSRIFAKQLIRNITLSIFGICDLDYVLSHSLDIHLDIMNSLDREFEEVFLLAKTLNDPILREIQLLFEFCRYIGNNVDFSSFRYYLLLIATCWHWLSYLYQQAATNSELLSGKNYNEKSYESLSKEYEQKKNSILNLYVCCVLLKERKLGKLPAWEGIRLVRYSI